VLAGVVLGSLTTAAAAEAGANPIIATATTFAPGTASWTPTPTAVSLSTLQQQACPTYSDPATLTLNGQAFTLPTNTWSVNTVLTCGLGLSLQPGDYIQVLQAGNGVWEAPLSYPDDLTTPSAFASSQLPVIYYDGTNIGYVRPPRSAADENASDQVVGGQPVSILVDEGGPPLSVAITETPSSEPIPTGTTVAFAASVTDPQGTPTDPTKLAFSWSISGGASIATGATSPAAAATFATAGTYSVTVQVADADGSGGAATTTIDVGAVPPSTSGTPNPGNGQTQQPASPPTGPQQGTGTAIGGSGGAPQDTQPSPGQTSHRRGHPAAGEGKPRHKHKPKPKPARPNGASPGRTTTTSSTTSSSTTSSSTATSSTTTASTTTTTTTATTTAHGGTSSGSSGASGSGSRPQPDRAAGGEGPPARTAHPRVRARTPVVTRSTPARHASRVHRSTPPAPPSTPVRHAPAVTGHHRTAVKGPPTPVVGTTSKAPLVTGRLIGSVVLLPAGASPLVHGLGGPAASPAPVRRGVVASVAPGLAGALAVILLLSLGAGRELRWRAGRRALRVGR
jgi:PKD domain